MEVQDRTRDTRSLKKILNVGEIWISVTYRYICK